MTGLTIRRAQAPDINAIMDLLRQVHDVHAHGRPDLFIKGKTKYTPDELARIIADDSRPIFVAIDTDGTLLGYAFCVDEDHTGSNNLQPIRTLYIDDICVDEAARAASMWARAVQPRARPRTCTWLPQRDTQRVGREPGRRQVLRAPWHERLQIRHGAGSVTALGHPHTTRPKRRAHAETLQVPPHSRPR